MLLPVRRSRPGDVILRLLPSQFANRNDDKTTLPANGTVASVIRQTPDNTPWTLIFLCWLIALVSALGSLFFSEVMEYVPCSLCWYQRIFLFPLVLVFTAALFPLDERVGRYALPLVVAGWLVAGYQNLLVWGIVPESVIPCSQGISCTEVDFELFGFLTIPLLSWMAFTAMMGLLLILKLRTSK